ncbi:hypothetical protein ACOTVT_11270, partial [Aliarcobacter butzleri]
MSGKNNNQIALKEAKNIIIGSLKYLFVVAIICTIIPVILRFDIKFFGNFNQENSLLEYFQLIFLFSTIVIFVRLSRRRPDLKYA